MSGSDEGGLNNRQTSLITVSIVCLGLSTVVVALRLLVRGVSAASFWWDDWVSVLALIFSWLPNIFTLYGVSNGLGKHVTDVADRDVTLVHVSTWIQEISWAPAMGFTIFAILAFYLRIFPQPRMHIVVYCVVAWTAAWTISTFFVLAFQCSPARYFWDRDIVGGACININVFYFICGLLSTLTVVAVLLLPLPVIWRLQVSTPKRMGLAFSFTAGIFVCVASIIRLVTLFNVDLEDLTYTSAIPQLWTSVEVSFAVIGACIPSLTPLLLMLFKKRPLISLRSTPQHPQQRNRRVRPAVYGRMPDLDESNQRSHSVELIVRGQNSCDKVGNIDGDKNQENSVPGIMVTRQMDQVSEEKSRDPSGTQYFGVIADASTSGH